MKDWLCKPTSLEEAKEIIERAVANGATLDEIPTAAGSAASGEYCWDLCDSWGVIEGETHTSDHVDCDGVEILTIDQVREQFPLPNEKSAVVEFYKDIDWLLNAHKLGATHHTWGDYELYQLYKIDYDGVHFYNDKKWRKSCWKHNEIIPKYNFYPIDYSPLESKTEVEDVVGSEMEYTTWNGTGYPQVGTVCEFLENPDEWIKGVVFGHRHCNNSDVEVFIDLIDSFDWSNDLSRFRPIRTEREQWIEAACEAMKELHLAWDSKDPASEQKCRLYAEAIHDKMIKQK